MADLKTSAAFDRKPLGAGWKFPIQVDPSGKIAVSRNETKVEESVYLILSTAFEERVMDAKFGSGVQELLFAPNTPSTTTLAVTRVRESLIKYEPRIDVLTVDAYADPAEPSLLLIKIEYRIRSNNARGNLVYPYFITEGA